MVYMRVTCLILVCALPGCAGIKFSPTEIKENQVLPPIIESSIPALIYRHDLNSLTGQLAVVDQNGKITPVLRAVDPQKLPIITTIPEEDGLLYRSLISQNGNAILKAATSDTNLAANQKAELVITQRTQSILQDIPRDVVLAKAALVTPQAGQKLVYITGSVLSLVKTTLFDEIDSNATITYGPVFGFNGKVYKSSSHLLNNYIITMNTVDVEILRDRSITTVSTSNDVAKELTQPAPTAPKPPEISGTSSTVAVPAQATTVNAPTLPPPPEPVISTEGSTKIEVVK